MEYKEIKVKGRVAKAFPQLIKEVITAAKAGWEPKGDFELGDTCRLYSTNYFIVKLERALEGKKDVNPSASLTDIPSASLTDIPSASLTDIPSASLTDIPSASLTDISSEKGSSTEEKTATEQVAPTVEAEEGLTEAPAAETLQSTSEDSDTSEEAEEPTVEAAEGSLTDADKYAQQVMFGRIKAAKTKKELVLLSQTFEIDVPENGNVNKIRKILNDTVKAMEG